MKIWWGIVAGAMLCACSDGKMSDPVEAFGNIPSVLQGDTLADLEEYDIYIPIRLVKRDSDFIILNQRSDCLLYQLNPYTKRCRQLIRRGKGPNEMLSLYSLRATGDKYIYASGLNQDRYAELTFENGQANVTLRPLPETQVLSILRGDDFIVGLARNEKGLYAYSAPDGSSLSYFCDYPEIPEAPNASPLVKRVYYGSCDMAIAPDQTRFARIHFPSGTIDLCSIGQGALERYKEIRFYTPEVVIDENSERPVRIRRSNRHGFCDIAATDERIYTIYSGRTFDEAGTGIDDCHYLMVFDWEGNPETCYELAQSVCGICYDEKENAVYGLSAEEGSVLLRFDLEDRNPENGNETQK